MIVCFLAGLIEKNITKKKVFKYECRLWINSGLFTTIFCHRLSLGGTAAGVEAYKSRLGKKLHFFRYIRKFSTDEIMGTHNYNLIFNF